MGEESLSDFIENVTGESHLRVEADLGDGFVRLLSSEAERRQAKHDIRSTEDIVIEMLRNARDAGAHLIFLATARDGVKRLITMVDDGSGVPEKLQEAIFEPRVTSKLDTYHMDRWGIHGRGMALFSIRSNAEFARVAASAPGLGTSITVVTDTRLLAERSDQSALPHVVQGEDGRNVMRGPRNLNRMVAEFVLEEHDDCQVFLGSPIEIVATMVSLGRSALASREGADLPTEGDCPLCLRPALAETPAQLAQTARSLGLEMSERSARRILDDQISPVPPFLSLLFKKGRAPARAADRPKRAASMDSDRLRAPVDPRGLRIAERDLTQFTTAVKAAWQQLADAYYLDGTVEPVVKVEKDGIRLYIPSVKQR